MRPQLRESRNHVEARRHSFTAPTEKRFPLAAWGPTLTKIHQQRVMAGSQFVQLDVSLLFEVAVGEAGLQKFLFQ